MGFENYKDQIALSASFCFLLQMLAPIPTCLKFIRTRSVGDMSAMPYITAYQSCMLWLIYGLVLHDIAISHPNILGALLQLGFVGCYYIYCNNKAAVRRQMMFATSVVALALAYCYVEPNHDVLEFRLGLVCVIITMVFFASPFATLRHVLKVWSSESLPGLFILLTFIVSVQWWIYGIIINNLFMEIPNLVGTILSGIQLLLILVLPKHSNVSLNHNAKILPT